LFSGKCDRQTDRHMHVSRQHLLLLNALVLHLRRAVNKRIASMATKQYASADRHFGPFR